MRPLDAFDIEDVSALVETPGYPNAFACVLTNLLSILEWVDLLRLRIE
jgi:hypothetical protein